MIKIILNMYKKLKSKVSNFLELKKPTKTFYFIVSLFFFMFLVSLCFSLFLNKNSSFDNNVIDMKKLEDQKSLDMYKNKTTEEVKSIQENMIQKVALGDSLKSGATKEMQKDRDTLLIITKTRNSLADYFDKNQKYPEDLDKINLSEKDLFGQGPASAFISYTTKNYGEGYSLIIKFETVEALLVAANLKNENKNEYDPYKKSVIFTEKSGNFFYFTGDELKK